MPEAAVVVPLEGPRGAGAVGPEDAGQITPEGGAGAASPPAGPAADAAEAEEAETDSAGLVDDAVTALGDVAIVMRRLVCRGATGAMLRMGD